MSFSTALLASPEIYARVRVVATEPMGGAPGCFAAVNTMLMQSISSSGLGTRSVSANGSALIWSAIDQSGCNDRLRLISVISVGIVFVHCESFG